MFKKDFNRCTALYTIMSVFITHVLVFVMFVYDNLH